MEKIDTLRKKLEKLVEKNAPFEEIYKISVELDRYIVRYYESVVK